MHGIFFFVTIVVLGPSHRNRPTISLADSLSVASRTTISGSLRLCKVLGATFEERVNDADATKRRSAQHPFKISTLPRHPQLSESSQYSKGRCRTSSSVPRAVDELDKDSAKRRMRLVFLRGDHPVTLLPKRGSVTSLLTVRYLKKSRSSLSRRGAVIRRTSTSMIMLSPPQPKPAEVRKCDRCHDWRIPLHIIIDNSV
jgi:hypothetical protein